MSADNITIGSPENANVNKNKKFKADEIGRLQKFVIGVKKPSNLILGITSLSEDITKLAKKAFVLLAVIKAIFFLHGIKAIGEFICYLEKLKNVFTGNSSITIVAISAFAIIKIFKIIYDKNENQ